MQLIGTLTLALAIGSACADDALLKGDAHAFQNARLKAQSTHHSMRGDPTGLSESVESGFLLRGHEVSPSDAVVLQVRKESPGVRGRSDSSYFEMLSIQVPTRALMKGAVIQFGEHDPENLAYYSTANYGFLDKGGCHGYGGAGWVEIEEVSENAVKAKLVIRFDLEDPSGFPDQCAPKSVIGDYVFRTGSI